MRSTLFIAALALLIATPARAQQDETPSALREAYACAGIATDAERLACYDIVIRRLREAESSGRIVTVDSELVTTIERESFGFSLPSMGALFGRRAGTAPIERVEMQIERMSVRADGAYSFVMTNGQIWTQIEAASVHNLDPGDTVAIRRAALGSFMLYPEHGRAYRVRRSQ